MTRCIWQPWQELKPVERIPPEKGSQRHRGQTNLRIAARRVRGEQVGVQEKESHTGNWN